MCATKMVEITDAIERTYSVAQHYERCVGCGVGALCGVHVDSISTDHIRLAASIRTPFQREREREKHCRIQHSYIIGVNVST